MLISHGRLDPVIPVQFGQAARDVLEAAGLPVDYREFEGGHNVDPRDLPRSIEWLSTSARFLSAHPRLDASVAISDATHPTSVGEERLAVVAPSVLAVPVAAAVPVVAPDGLAGARIEEQRPVARSPELEHVVQRPGEASLTRRRFAGCRASCPR